MVAGHFFGGPVGYNGGTGCKDTYKSVIHLRGPNLMKFQISKCGGLSGVIRAKNVNERNEKMIAEGPERVVEEEEEEEFFGCCEWKCKRQRKFKCKRYGEYSCTLCM